MLNEIRQRLVKVRNLLKRGFTQHTFARTKYGHRCSPISKSAARFCVLGAIERICRNKKGKRNSVKEYEVRNFLNEKIGFSIADYNDSHTKAEVISRLDKIISNV